MGGKGEENSQAFTFFPKTDVGMCVNVAGIQQLTLGLLVSTNTNSLGQYHSYISYSVISTECFQIQGKRAVIARELREPLLDSQEALNIVSSGILNWFLVHSIPSCRNLCQTLEATKMLYER